MKLLKSFLSFFVPAVLITGLALIPACDGLLGGEPAPPATIAERLRLFEDDLNREDRSEIYLHFHANADSANSIGTLEYNQIKDTTYFDNSPLAWEHRDFNIRLSADDPVVEGERTIVTGTFTTGAPAEFGLEVYMRQAAGIWYIEQFILKQGVTEEYAIRKIEAATN